MISDETVRSLTSRLISSAKKKASFSLTQEEERQKDLYRRLGYRTHVGYAALQVLLPILKALGGWA